MNNFSLGEIILCSNTAIAAVRGSCTSPVGCQPMAGSAEATYKLLGSDLHTTACGAVGVQPLSVEDFFPPTRGMISILLLA